MREYDIYLAGARKHDIYLNRKIQAINLYIRSLTSRIGFSAASGIVIQAVVEAGGAIVKNPVDGVISGIVLDAACLSTLETIFMEVEHGIGLQAEVENTNGQVFTEGATTLGIVVSPFEIFRAFPTGAESTVSVTAEILETDTHGSLGRAENAILFTISTPEIQMTKKLELDNTVGIQSEADVVAVMYTPAEDAIGITQEIETSLRRYRLLREVDPLALNEIDDMSLEELDWVTIE